jgi:hypothetical protein
VVSHGVVRSVGLVAAGLALASLAACGGGAEAQTGGDWVAPTSSPAPSPSAPARVAKITSACKLLPAKSVVKLLGGTASTKLTARELPVEKEEGDVEYTCAYGRGGEEPFVLKVSHTDDQATRAKDTIDNIAEASGSTTTPINDLGEAGVGYVKDDFRIVAVAQPYEKDLRLVIFVAPKIVPQKKLVEVMEQVVVKI